VVTRENQFLLNLLRVRLIVDGSAIYQLEKNKTVVIPLPTNHSKIVVTDGFHYSQPLEVVYHHIPVYYFKISCAVDNNKLLAGGVVTVLLFFAGLTSDIIWIMLLSLAPILFFLYQFYIRKKEFILIKPVSSF